MSSRVIELRSIPTLAPSVSAQGAMVGGSFVAEVWISTTPAGPVRDTTLFVTSPLDAAMDRYANGDDSAFPELYDGLAPRLFAFLLRQTRDRAKAEDVVQQTMLQIHRARGRFIPGSGVLPWAFAIARRLLIDQHRRGSREVLSPTDDDTADLLMALDAPADDLAIAREVALRIEKELARLPENQRVAFELIKQEGLSVAEAAQVLGTTVAAVKLRAHRAYEALRAALGDALRRGDEEKP